MVGSTGAIKTMRLLRNKNHKRDEIMTTATAAVAAASSASMMDDATVAAASAAASNQHKRHNSSITSNTSSVSTASSASSSSSTSSQHHHSSSSQHQYHQHHLNLHHHHHRHHRSNSMRDQCLDLPYDGTDDGHLQQPAIAYRQSPASVWVFPPLPPQPNLYCNTSQDALMQFEKAGLKGFRKQFSGRFKRFVLRKPAEPAPAIPPELKCQLKTIFVY